MQRQLCKALTVFWCGTMLVTGCAKQEMVKKETPPPEVAVTAPTPAPPVTKETTPPPTTAPAQETTAIKEEPISPAPTSAQVAEQKLQTVYFDFDSSVLRVGDRDILTKNADTLKKSPGMKIQVEGNCDERGSDEYNLALGERRAKAAMNYLITLGIPADRLSFISYGKEKPADPGHDEAAWAKNRRDDFVVLK